METTHSGRKISRRGWIALGCLAVLTLAVAPRLEVWSEAVIHLLAGGFFYVSRTLPQVRLDAVTLFNSVLGVVIVSVVLHLLLRGFVKRKGEGDGMWRWKWTLSIMATLAVAFGTCVATLGLVHHGSSLFAERTITQYSNGSLRSLDVSHALQIFRASTRHAERNGGNWPRDVTALFVPALLGRSSFLHVGVFLAGGPRDVPETWIVLGGPPPPCEPDLPLVVAPRSGEDGARLVVFHDGKVRNLRGDEWQAALGRWLLAIATERHKPEGAQR